MYVFRRLQVFRCVIYSSCCLGLSCCFRFCVLFIKAVIVVVLRDFVSLCPFHVSQDKTILFRDYLNSFLYDVVGCVYDLEIFAHIPKVTCHKSLHL